MGLFSIVCWTALCVLSLGTVAAFGLKYNPHLVVRLTWQEYPHSQVSAWGLGMRLHNVVVFTSYHRVNKHILM